MAPPVDLAAAAEQARVEAALLRERLRLYERNTRSTLVGHGVVALLVLWVFGRTADARSVAVWLAVLAFALGFRVAVALRQRRAHAAGLPASAARLWQSRLAAAGTGASWGVAGMLLFPADHLQGQMLLAFVLAGMAAGSLTLTAFDLVGAGLFGLLALLPYGLRLLATGGTEAATMATMVLMFVGFLGLTGWRAQRQVRETVAAREAEARRAEALLEHQQRQAQLSEQLRQQSDALAVTLGSMDQGILSLDSEGRTRFYNRRALELLDLPESFLATRPTMDDIARYQRAHGHFGEDFGLVEEPVRGFLEGWFAGEHKPFPGSYLRRTRSGTMLEVKTHYLAGGALVRTFSDVTAFFEARQRLLRSQAQESKLALVAAHTDNTVVITDAQDRIEWVNQAFAALTGLTPAEAAGRSFAELLRRPGSDLQAIARRDEQLRRDQKSSAELCYRLGDGRDLWVAIETHAVLDGEGRVQQYITIGRDITARHAAEEQLRKARDEAERASRAKSEFLSAMSHELRTPMNAILGFAQLLESDPVQPLPDRQRAHVQQILRAGSHLLELINDVLDLARVEAGKQQIAVEPIALGPLVGECLDLMHPLAEERAVRLGRAVAVPCGCAVLADRTRLKQVLLNVLSNAIKYNRAGGTVSLNCRDAEDAVLIGIADTGPGIAPEQRERLFTAFERLGAEAGPVEGAGIGLALSRRMLELMDGRIDVDSEAGRGSTFWIRLRRAAAGTPAPASVPDAVAPPTAVAEARTRRVLYIEDNPVNVLVMEAALEREPGVHLVSAPLPELGLDLARTERPDLVLLDIHLPGIDGFEVLRRLRAAEATRATPVVAVSANAMPSDIERALAAGFDDYLTKPFDLEKLRVLVRRTWTRRAPVAPAASAS